jgi:four helix bundle protein
MDEKTFKKRTKQIALDFIELTDQLPKTRSGSVIGKQLLRSATSVGANYRAACRGKSVADVISKMSIVEEEADESLYWCDLLKESGLISEKTILPLEKEMNEILAMTVASIKTLRSKQKKGKG